ncbi:MAG: hypothetical protein GVY30_00185 [Chloroflexi bacterium]|jgi:hypothetical protein|nr:hypothetical protein [Chloroflexota bacterium]
MDEYADLGAWAFARLQADTDVVASVMPDMIFEAGDLRAEDINAAQAKRKREELTDRVLAIVVIDSGQDGQNCSFSVLIYDRYGYTNIRTARQAVIAALINCPAKLPRAATISEVKFTGRSGFGFSIDPKVDMDFERVDFEGRIFAETDTYF